MGGNTCSGAANVPSARTIEKKNLDKDKEN